MPSLDQIINNFDQHANFYIRAITNPLLSTFLDPTEPQTTEENIAGETVALLEKTANRLHPDLKAGDRPRPLFAGAGDFFALLTSTPAKHAMLDVLMGPELKKRFPITEDSIESDELTFLRQMYLQHGLGKISVEDYGGVGFNIVADPMADEKMFGMSAASRMQSTTGTSMFIRDENGDVILDDQYDQNLYVNYKMLEDPSIKKSKAVYETERFEKEYAGISGFTRAVWETLSSDATNFQKIHNLAFLMGSRDYRDNKKDVGRKVKINIGNPDLDFAKAAFVDGYKDLAVSHDGNGLVVHSDENITGPLPRPTNIKLYKTKTLNTDYDDDIPPHASDYFFHGPMTNKRASLFDMFIGRAEASTLNIPVPVPRPAKIVDVATPTSRPTMRDIQESQGDFAFEGPAA